MALITCPECSKQVSDQARTCPNCGYPLESNNYQSAPQPAAPLNNQRMDVAQPNTNSAAQREEYVVKKDGSIKIKKKRKKGCLIGTIVVGLFLFGVIYGIVYEIQKQKDASSIEGITPEQNQAVVDALNECGITEFKSITHDELLDNMETEGEKGYRVSSNGIDNIILYLIDGEVTQIRYADKTLYEDGTAVNTIASFTMTSSEEVKYITAAQNVVKSVLKAPSTAKFSTLDTDVWKDDGLVTVRSYVDAENSFGAMMRSEYKIVFDGDTPISFIFDGEEYLK